MKTKMMFSVSLAGNAMLLCALAFALNNAFSLPESTPPLVRYVFTNAVPVTIEAASPGKVHGLPAAAGSDTNPADARH